MAKRSKSETPEKRYARWVRSVDAALEEIAQAFWNRRVFRAVERMFDTNRELQQAEGSLAIRGWIRHMYGQYTVMLIRRELDKRYLTLASMLHDMEDHHDVLVTPAQGRPVPSAEKIKQVRLALKKTTQQVVRYSHRFIAHRNPPEEPTTTTFTELEQSLRAIRFALIKYRCVLKGVTLLSTTPTDHLDLLAPFGVAWLSAGFQEPELEEEAPMSDEEKRANRAQKRRLGFSRR